MSDAVTKRTLTRRQARELALKVLRAKLESAPELAKVRNPEALRMVTLGLASAFRGKGIVLDEESAEGVYEAILEIIPAARDDAKPSIVSGLWTPPKRPRLWRPS